MATKRKCVCCGKEYEYCPTCSKKGHPAWMTTFDSELCKELFNIVSAYNLKLIGKAQVQAFVAEHGIIDYTKYTESIRKTLEEVVPKMKQSFKDIEASDNIPQEQEVTPIAEVRPAAKKYPRHKRKKKIGY